MLHYFWRNELVAAEHGLRDALADMCSEAVLEIPSLAASTSEPSEHPLMLIVYTNTDQGGLVAGLERDPLVGPLLCFTPREERPYLKPINDEISTSQSTYSITENVDIHDN